MIKLKLLVVLLLCLAPVNVQSQTVKYIAPDAAAPGMSVVIDFIGPNTVGNFGADGFYAIGDKVALKTASDSVFVKLGPAIVSWDGKFVQAMMLIEHSATPRDIALVVKNGTNESATFFFSIVNSENIPAQSGGGTLGQGIGSRSKRGTMVVDSLILNNGTYNVSTADPDGAISGNQGYLPLRILSKGSVRLNNATINVRGRNGSDGSHGGPGGGGGGGGALRSGGDGFTGGGGVGPAPRKGGDGAGSSVGSRNHHGGKALNDLEGGFGTEYGNSSEGNDEGGGGGTGHPFGSSGSSGIYGAASRPGGRGAGSGSGQGQGLPTFVTYGGGGGGYATAGANGGGQGANGGLQIGNRMIAPLSGGSGGGSGNIWYSSGTAGHGGGGGGAVEVTSFKTIEIVTSAIDASGGNASNGTAFPQNGSGGGGGSGGAIHISARDSIHIRSTQSSPILNINGGSRGTGYNQGGDGGKGRIRLDGRVSTLTGHANTSQFFEPTKDFIGPVITTVEATSTTFKVRGYGRGWVNDYGNAMRMFYRFASTGWQSVDFGTAPSGNSNTAMWASADIPRSANIFDTTVYLVVLQANFGSSGDQWSREPERVMSHASGMIGFLPGVPLIEVAEDTIDFGKLRVDRCKDSTAVVRSMGSATLDVGIATLEGDITHFVIRTTDSLHIPVEEDELLGVAFCPKDTGCFEAVVRIRSNGGERTVRLFGCGILPEISTLSDIDFGRVRVGICKDTTITITNPGTDTLTIADQIFTNTDFSAVSPVLPVRIAPGESAQFTLRFCANVRGVVTGTDTIISDARDPDWPIGLRGQGIRGELSFEEVLDFGEVLVGSCKDSFVTITNIGDDTLFVVDPPVLGAFFTVTAGQLPIALAPGASAELFIRFCPTGEIEYTATDSIRPLDPVSAKRLAVLGKGVKGLLSVPNAIDHLCVILGETIFDTLVIENEGSGIANTITASVSPSDLTLVRSPATSLAPGAKDSIIVRFTPTAIGDFRGEIRIGSNGLPDLQIPYTAHVTEAPILQYITRILDFDTVDVGETETLCVTVTNPSCRPLTITDWRLLDGDIAFTLQGVTLPITLVDSSIFEFCVTATSGTSGIYVDSLVFTTDAGTFTDVAVTANVQRVRLRLDPDSLDFGTNDLNVIPPMQQATLMNAGTTPASIAIPQIVGPDASLFSFTGGPSVVTPGEQAVYDITYLASSVGDHLAYFVANTGTEFDSVVLTGRTIPVVIPLDTVDVIVYGDSLMARPGEMLLFALRTYGDLTGAGVTQATFRVQFDPMRLDLKGGVIVNAIFDAVTVQKHSLGDWTVSVTSADTVTGSGAMAYLNFEVLLASSNEVPIRISEAEFGEGWVNVIEENPGQITVMECDTTSNIVFGSFSQISAIRPNPARHHVRVPIKLSQEADVAVRLYNPLGVMVHEGVHTSLIAGEHHVPVNLQGLPQSIYLLEVQATSHERIERHRARLSVQ